MFQTGEAKGQGRSHNVIAFVCFTQGWPGY